MHKILTIFVMLLLTSVTSACRNQSLYKPRPIGITGPPADAPENYLAGWKDGCETGMSTMSTSWYKTFYGYKMSVNQMQDPEYYRAWRDSYTYCRHYSFKSLWDPLDKMDNKSLDEKICVLCMFR